MSEISELIYETCKAYMVQQGKFLLLLEVFIGVVIVAYFWMIGLPVEFLIGIVLVCAARIGGSYGVAVPHHHQQPANSRTAFASLTGKPYPVYAIPLRAGMSVGMMLISVELLFMLAILLFVPGEYAGACFLGFAIGESLGASALRIAGGIFTKIADIGSDLMKIVFKIKEDDARNPGVIADCTGDNAGDSVGPTADGFETYGVTGVALISFILLAVPDAPAEAKLLVDLRHARDDGDRLRRRLPRQRSGRARPVRRRRQDGLRGPPHPARVDHLDLSGALTYVVSYLMVPELGDGTLWWKLSTVITCGTLAGAVIPELVKVFTSTNSAHVPNSPDDSLRIMTA